MSEAKKSIRSIETGEKSVRTGAVSLQLGDSRQFYKNWLPPTCIIADGPYGLGKFPGEPHTPDGLAEWYAPHIAAWAAAATTETTLWFWCSELGWANVHYMLDKLGWQYEECCIWDKGIAHVAGNCNSKTIRGVPVVTEVAVRYTRKAVLKGVDGAELSLKEWVRAEWERSGLPMYRANEACNVKNAATRKYLTKCHMWYFPPPEAIVGMSKYCEKYGHFTERPYFSIDGQNSPTVAQWERMRSKWYHTHGITNVWQEPPVHGQERIRVSGRGSEYIHANQKPLSLMERQILSCTDEGDVIWEPFGGLCSATTAAIRLGRRAHSAEVNPDYYSAAAQRLLDEVRKLSKEARVA